MPARRNGQRTRRESSSRSGRVDPSRRGARIAPRLPGPAPRARRMRTVPGLIASRYGRDRSSALPPSSRAARVKNAARVGSRPRLGGSRPSAPVRLDRRRTGIPRARASAADEDLASASDSAPRKPWSRCATPARSLDASGLRQRVRAPASRSGRVGSAGTATTTRARRARGDRPRVTARSGPLARSFPAAPRPRSVGRARSSLAAGRIELPEHRDYETLALPTELRRRFERVDG